MNNVENLKKIVAKASVDIIESGMLVGLGTGSTVKYAVEEISRRKLNIECVSSSLHTEIFARSLGIKVISIDDVAESGIDVYIDGADQVDKNFNLIKGGGAAHFREKLLAKIAEKFIVIVDESKLAESLNMPVPIEVVPFAWRYVLKELKKMGADAKIRVSKKWKYGVVITDNNNFILDANFGTIKDPKKLEENINKITGVVENGIFKNDLVSEIYVGTSEGLKILKPG